MKKVLIVVLGLFAVMTVFAAIAVGGFLGFRTDCVNAEIGIKAQHEQNKNSYDSMWKTFKEMAQVPEMQVAHLKQLYDGTMEGRYGEDGSKAVVQFIQEQNPQLTSAMYVSIQAAIESGRRTFKADQTQLIAQKAAYEKILGSNQAIVYNAVLNFPKINLDDYGIVTSGKTKQAFATGEDEEIQLAPKRE